jgi:hypothetical protein
MMRLKLFGLRLVGVFVPAVTGLVLLLGGVCVAPAAASVPWWHLTSGSRPTYLHPGLTRDEVQEVVVTATSGDFYLEDPATGKADVFPPLVYNASSAEVQQALEEKVYGAGNVQVEDGVDSAETHVWRLKFVGAMAGQRIKVRAESFPLTFGELHGLEGGVKEGQPVEGNAAIQVREVEEGRAGLVVATVSNLGGAVAHGECVNVGAGAGSYSDAGCTEEVALGSGEYSKDAIVITDKLPAGLKALSVQAESAAGNHLGEAVCSVISAAEVSCVLEHAVPSYSQIEVRVGVEVTGSAPSGSVNESEVNEVSVKGGGASAALLRHPLRLSSDEVPFGIENYELANVDSAGAVDTQAGSHPFETTFTVGLNQESGGFDPQLGKSEALPVALPRDLQFRLPPGLIGNPTPFPECSLAQFFHKPQPTCSNQSVVGVAEVTFDEPGVLDLEKISVPVYNVEPRPGEPARFGFLVTNIDPVFVDSAVRSGQDYGIMGVTRSIPQTAALISSEVTFWGVPGEASHDASRGLECLRGNACPALEENDPPPFFELPTSCTGPLRSEARGDSWTAPVPEGSELPQLASYSTPTGLDGCNQVPFHPSISVVPDVTSSSSAVGLTVDVHNPQESSLNAEVLGEANVKDITVALPEGVVVNPSGGNGLLGCSEALVGFEGFSEFVPGDPAATFAGELPKNWQEGEGFCPSASKIGTAKITTPLLHHPIEGAVYLATQNENPFGSLVAMYVIAEDEASGVSVMLTGEVKLSPGTGQIITTFKNSPQDPFEDAEISFFGGPGAALATPAHCANYTTVGAFTPWSAEPGDAPHTAESTFSIDRGPAGSGCPGVSLPFSPSLTGGTTNINAGAFSPLATTITRSDGQQALKTVQIKIPPGVEGVLTGVKLCPEAQANAGTCGAESLLGEATTSAGVGSEPVVVSGGRVYLTEGYEGSPFGLSIVSPVKAGPFDLEHDTANPAQSPACDCLVVRARIDVDPVTAAITVTTDASGSHAIPRVIDGIPVELQKINVLINRPRFTFNPTDCGALSMTGTIFGAEEGAQAVSAPFQSANCALLKFTPSLSARTAGHASRSNGASLEIKITYPKDALGKQAWFKEAKLDFPKQLSARNTTIQKACLAATFEKARAQCPKASIIGHAVVHTPVLPVALEGPVYFVSYGGAKFPDAVMVLSGYGITVELHGNTFIVGKTGLTSVTFKSLPDVPFESIDVTIPSGPFSEFGANLPASANLSFCGQSLKMPTMFKAANGIVIRKTANLAITGCGKPKTRAQHLAASLKTCRKNKKTRAACEQHARKQYGLKKKKTAKH